jgi:plastocyanin
LLTTRHFSKEVTMYTFRRLRPIFALACAAALAACQAPGATAPSALAAPGVTGLHDDAPPPPPDPTPTPTPDPAPAPPPVTISIVGTAGTQAFNPNPSAAAVGDMIVWANNDKLLHHIVLDDGTDVGDIAPGESSKAVALATPTAGYHCTLHPSMVGSINGQLAPPMPDPEPPADPYYPTYYVRSAHR